MAGYMCIDSKGLVLSSSGVAKKDNAPLFASLCQLASELDPGTTPVLVIETTKS